MIGNLSLARRSPEKLGPFEIPESRSIRFTCGAAALGRERLKKKRNAGSEPSADLNGGKSAHDRAAVGSGVPHSGCRLVTDQDLRRTFGDRVRWPDTDALIAYDCGGKESNQNGACAWPDHGTTDMGHWAGFHLGTDMHVSQPGGRRHKKLG
jgi:hypothetical protein